MSLLTIIILMVYPLFIHGGHGDTCPCDTPVLSCINNRCICPREQENPSPVIWEASAQMCFLLEGEICVPQPTFQDSLCIPTASCQVINGNPVCVCQKGLSQNVEGKCHLRVGQWCDLKLDFCDPLQFLRCGQEFKCGCGKGAFYDENLETCVLFVDFICDPVQGPDCINITDCTNNNGESRCSCKEPNTLPFQEDLSKCYLPYGASCNTVMDFCNPSLFQICESNVCRCIGEDNNNSKYDTENRQCVRLADEICEKDGMSCIHSASCKNISGLISKCSCHLDLSINAEKMCYSKYGKTCNVNNDMCNQLQNLKCGLENKCACEDKAAYLDELEICALLPGSPCTNDGASCIEGTNCFENFCQCDNLISIPSKHSPTKCALPHEATCQINGNIECDPSEFLVCDPLQSICKCKDNEISIYDEVTKRCVVLANEVCTNQGMPCLPSSSCMSLGFDNDQFRCRCKFGLVPNADRFCHQEFGRSCFRENDLCDPLKFLNCGLENKCECEDGAFYSEDLETCLLLPGSPCSENGTSCVEETNCLENFCQCENPNSIPSKHHPTKCVLPHEATCQINGNIECDPSEFLVCDPLQRICKCKDNEISIYDEVTKRCVVLANEVCTNQGMPCLASASCMSLGFDNDQFRCRCKFGLVPNADRFCQQGYGKPCNLLNDMCDYLKQLRCGLENKCECVNIDAAIYLEALGTCLLKPGARCEKVGTADLCINGTSCIENQCKCDNPTSIPSSQDPTLCVLPYGAKCKNKNIKCDPAGFFECDGVCKCKGERNSINSSIYDENTKRCVLLASEPCTLLGMPCISSATCRSVGARSGTLQCACNYNLVPNSEKFCHQEFGLSCIRENDLCDPVKHLKCGQENFCECKDKNGVYDFGLSKCVGIPDSTCGEPLDPLCISQTQCLDKKCVCFLGAKPSTRDPTKCFLSYKDSCNVNTGPLCDPYINLECIRGQCMCQDEPHTSVFDTKTKICLRLAEGICDTLNTVEIYGEMPCIHSAQCKKEGNNRQKCICRPPFFKGSDNFCYLKHAQNCSTFNDLCDPNSFLACDLEGKCSCGNKSIYNQTEKICNLLPGEKCDLILNSQPCVNTTQCANYGGDDQICRCPGASQISPIDSTLCVLDQKMPCSSINDLCDPYSYLKCSSFGQCVCSEDDKSHFASDVKKCYLKAGQDCSNENTFTQKCTPNSMCIEEKGHSTKCVCRKGFYANRNGQCFLPFKSTCALDNDLCDHSAFLSCNLHNKCTCGQDAEYNEIKETCRLLVNATCVPTKLQPLKAQPCVPNSFCSESTLRCKCMDNLTINNERHCALQHGSTCNPVFDLCDPLSQLECGLSTRTCLCQGEYKGYGMFSKFQQKCLLLAGAQCGVIGSSQCIHNSYCDLVDQICVCNETLKLVPNKERHCFLPFKTNCDSKNDLCDPEAFLECANGLHQDFKICKCQRDYETFYDEVISSCRLISDRPCSPTSTDSKERVQLCDQNALCEPTAPGNFTHRCICNPGFSHNNEKICFYEYEADCFKNPTQCDPLGHLGCRKNESKINVCLCASNKMYFNEQLKQCLTFPGERCQPFQDAQKCRENSHCGKNEICECLTGYEATLDGQCLLKYREKCDDKPNNCNDQVNLECLAGFCLCREGFLEHQLESGSLSQIVCLPGYNMTCIPSLPSWECNPGAFLRCNDEGVCRCNNEFEQAFIGSERQCRSILNMPCNDLNEICVPFAKCSKPELSLNGKCVCDENSTASWKDTRFCVKNISTVHSKIMFNFLLTIYIVFKSI